MIGGNQRFEEKASKELIIRWLQVSVFMPCLQFSIAPWDFDEQTVNISLKYSKLHEDYADLILKRFKLAVTAGDPGMDNNEDSSSLVTISICSKSSNLVA